MKASSCRDKRLAELFLQVVSDKVQNCPDDVHLKILRLIRRRRLEAKRLKSRLEAFKTRHI